MDCIVHGVTKSRIRLSNFHSLQGSTGFPGESALKNPPVIQETQVQFLGQEDPLEKG